MSWFGPGSLRAGLVFLLACGQRSAPAPAVVSLGGDAARVGDIQIPFSVVDQVARSRGVAPRAAVDGLVEDALLTEAARAAGLDREPSVAWASAVAVARFVSERLNEEARMRGAPTADELATVRVVHAVVLRSPTLPRTRVLAVAEAIQQAVSSARTDEEFEARAKQVPHSGAQLTVQRLSKFDASGRTEEGEEFDLDFVAAAFTLHAPGETSAIVETTFGWHVIRLMERVPPEPASLERRRQELTDPVLRMRVRTWRSVLVNSERRRTLVEVPAAADELMAKAVSTP